MKLVKTLWKWFVEALFPPRCIVTGREGTYLSEEVRNFSPAPENQAQFQYLDGIYAHTAYYDPVVEQVVEYFKFKGFKQLAGIIASDMTRNIPASFFNDAVLVPIPLHWTRKLYRGFNQAEVLAKALNSRLSLQHYLKRRKRTSQQARLSKSERLENLDNAFIWNNRSCAPSRLGGAVQRTEGVYENIPQTVILVDDVVASGSTLDQAAKACKDAGVRRVYAIVFARGGKGGINNVDE